MYGLGGENLVRHYRERVLTQYGINYQKSDHIIAHRKYTPFINVDGIIKRIAPVTMFVRREDVFDIVHERFVHEPIKRPVRLSGRR